MARPHLSLMMAGIVGAALALLSWIPADYKLQSGVLWTQGDHAVAYAAAAISVSVVAGRTLSLRTVLAFLIAMATVLELGQAFFPGRTPALVDWVGSVGGALAGIFIVFLLRAVLRPLKAAAA